MKERSRFPNFGANYLQPGCSAIHFYYSRAEQLRFVGYIAEGLRLGQAVVLAAPAATVQEFKAALTLPRFRKHAGNLHEVELATDLATSVPLLTQAVHQAALPGVVVRLLADFSSSVPHDGVFEVEAELSSSFHGLRLISVTQYDGTAVPAPITVEQFKTHSLAIVGDAFYYENRQHIPPEAYYRKRAAAAAAH